MRFIFCLLLLLVACNKPDPNPELKDAIYQDMQTEMGIAEKALAEAKKNVEEQKKALNAAAPQTGRVKYAKMKVWEAEKVVDTLEQQKKYWIIRVDQRRDFIRHKSLEAFNKGVPLDRSKEVDEYMAEKRLRSAKLKWDAKQRREDFLKESKLSTGGKPGQGGAPAAGHGG